MVKSWSAEIIAIGSELLLGQIVDTNTAYLAARPLVLSWKPKKSILSLPSRGSRGR